MMICVMTFTIQTTRLAKLKAGARKLDDGRYEFYNNNSYLGTNTGGGRNLYEGQVGKSNRWRATTLMQEEVEASKESLGKLRDVDEDRDGKLDTCVTDGYAIIGTITITKPGSSQTKEVDEVKMYIDGEMVYKGPDTTWDGRHMSYPEILGEGNEAIDGIEYRPYFQ